MKVLYVASEATPFIASGGLADVAGSLPFMLRKRMVGCRVVLPLYAEVPQEMRDTLQFVGSFSVPVAWRRQYCGVYEAHIDGVIYYLLDNQYYFKRTGIYGHYDDAERFAFFSRAVLEMLPVVDFHPDIIEANDWQTGMIPVYYDRLYANDPWYQGIKTIFTIHNIQYQGKYSMEILEDVLGLKPEDASIMEYDGALNMMKGAIETAHSVTTVSPTYAQEILDPAYSCGMDYILKERAWKLSGILNGIDVVSYDPETDKKLYQNYNVETVAEGKAVNKQKLQERLGLEVDPDVPLYAMVTRLVEQKGLDLVEYIANRFMYETNAQFVLLGSGGWEYEEFFRAMENKYKGRFVAYIGFVPELARKIYAGADIFLMPSKSEPCGLAQMISLRYGTLPIVRETGGLKDSVTDCGDGEGNGFTFQTYNADDMYDAMMRAMKAYNDKELWPVLVERAMNCDNSWGHSASEYIRLYRSLLKE